MKSMSKYILALAAVLAAGLIIGFFGGMCIIVLFTATGSLVGKWCFGVPWVLFAVFLGLRARERYKKQYQAQWFRPGRANGKMNISGAKSSALCLMTR
jgi:membrane protein implicated in regulation of membrane protease activity